METIAAHRQLANMAIFAHVVELNGFSAAARALGVSKSAVSKQIRKLEDGLGVSLLARSTRRLSLTAAGEVYYESCARVVSEAAAVEQTISDLRQRPTGRLRINAPVELGCMQVAPIVAAFIERYPEVHVELVLQDDRVDVVSESVDVAIRIGKLEDSTLIARRIGPIRTLFVAAPAYIARHGQPLDHTELRDHAFLLYSLMANPKRIELRKKGRRYRVTLNGPLSSNNSRARREAGLRGLGIIHVPDFYIKSDLAAGRLVPVLVDYELPKISMYAVYPPGTRTVSQRLLIDFMVEHLGKGLEGPENAAS